MRLLPVGKKGDTIVEVLLAIIVISATLGAAFATTNRGTLGTRASQERGEALKYGESQVELLKTAAAQGTPGVFGNPNAFCLQISGSTIVSRPAVSGGKVLTLEGQDLSDYTSDCRMGSIPSGYNVSITEDATTNIFTTRVRWENINGDYRDQIEIKYRIKP